MDMAPYLCETELLDYSAGSIQALIEGRGWRALEEGERIGRVYDFVRDEVAFGYNARDDLPASRVLADGYGQCNTKATLLMALLRAVGVPCRCHGFTIDKRLQKGAMTGLVYRSAPRSILHSWVEVLYAGDWYALEGVILDKPYLQSLQRQFYWCYGPFCAYGVAVKNLMRLEIDWKCCNTFIQREGINQDLGRYPSPDALMRKHGQQLTRTKEFLYRHVGRRLMNRRIRRIRTRGGRISEGTAEKGGA